MAAYRSIGTTAIATRDGAAWSVTITKPSGLTAGDYMVAIIGTSSGNAVEAISGWTLLGEQANGGDARLIVYGKTADSSDASASDFTFAVHTGNGSSNDGMGGALIAISGTQPLTNGAFIDFGTSNGTNHTYTGGITPTVANSILIMAMWGHGSTPATVSNYAITTDNPTWTERFDDAEAVGTSDYLFAVATAPRTEVTATGNFTLDSTQSYDTAGVLLAVLEAQNVTASPAVITMTATVQGPSVSGGATVSTTVITMTATVQAPTVTTSLPTWSNTDKSSSSWTNLDKS